jgi:hypothetical protein
MEFIDGLMLRESDGQRFLSIAQTPTSNLEYMVVVNWTAEAKK